MSESIVVPGTWNNEQAAPTATAEQLLRRVHEQFGEAGVTISASKVSRIVRAYLRDARATSIPDFDAWFMPHVDPTGETAIYNLTRGER
ncbi:hypothetical protein [Agreia sp. Leaf210]|uniref:hypothetical protein n=1 Tax=Agreia sp. Leaf210 TaxID=1735682 RepID=UPI0006FB358D|nr:hypothetical protein [Agreia sp. Leaf210]KQM58187.1 hypothetical protein ASE64_11640 [Agreia sp. Leaf210]